MACHSARNRYVDRSTWTALSCRTLTLLTTVAILAATASLLTASMGAPDGAVPVAFATVSAFVLGLAFVRLVVYLEQNGVPVLE